MIKAKKNIMKPRIDSLRESEEKYGVEIVLWVAGRTYLVAIIEEQIGEVRKMLWEDIMKKARYWGMR